ncbi:Hypothetical predicted protein [Marmota monax]|uniref:Teneurin N-terminal domain-containing protein n=1 Tax=Marmota monax TaxID=9995 RepID=A0A5E4AL29_MARMO|nr:hypothetical protein GHT09_014281 [Marmota monax]VTJ57456.1 Hypothetical predicted protein [Marmota monax]
MSPCVRRNLGKQPFLGTLQDNLIEMDILSASRHDGAYGDGSSRAPHQLADPDALWPLFIHRHFLFKPGGTSPLFCTTSPGYPLTSSTVYSPPPRPLPRSTFSRPAFNLKKPSKYCNWKCAALSAIVISATLVILLAYFVGKCILIPAPHGSPLAQRAANKVPVGTEASLPAQLSQYTG